jgi:hypothetical protein
MDPCMSESGPNSANVKIALILKGRSKWNISTVIFNVMLTVNHSDITTQQTQPT